MANLTTKTYNQQGKEIGSFDLNSDIFGVDVRVDIMHLAVVAQMANSRRNLAKTKGMGEVSGGGKKPWKQKGTGRARHGSSRSPLWRGGGVTFGPDGNRNFSKGINKKVRRQAIFMGLADKFNDEKLILLEKLELTGAKTQDLNKILLALPCKDAKNLLVIDKQDENIVKSANNLGNVKVILADSLNAYDVIDAEYIIMTQASIPVLEKTYLEKTIKAKIETIKKVSPKKVVEKSKTIKEVKPKVKKDLNKTKKVNKK